MELTNLTLQNFRNFADLELPLGPGMTVIHGENGQGKSNLLEGAYLLSIGKSWRASVERDMVQWGAAGAGGMAIVAGTVRTDKGKLQLRVGLDCRGGPDANVTKRVRVNGVAKRASELVGLLNAVLFSADDIALVYGSPSGRRRYLDVLISQMNAGYVHALQRYQRVLTQRNHLLRSTRERRVDDAELRPWDEALCAEGGVILGVRQQVMASLVPLARGYFSRLAGGLDGFDLAYAATVSSVDGASPADAMLEALVRSRRHERALGATVVGPHRDDLSLLLGGMEMTRHASRGQARIAALALRLAEGALLAKARGEAPVLLLDDILSELDEERRTLVLGEASAYGQTLLTTADLGLVPSPHRTNARRLHIEAGRIVEESAV